MGSLYHKTFCTLDSMTLVAEGFGSTVKISIFAQQTKRHVVGKSERICGRGAWMVGRRGCSE